MTTIVTVKPWLSGPIVRTATPGWNPLTPDLGFQYDDATGTVQFRAARGGWYAVRVDRSHAPLWEHEGYLPPRAILTIRPDSPAPNKGLLRVIATEEDWRAGGGYGIDACGAEGSVHMHDALMQRAPIGLYDMATGRLRDAKSVPVEGYYRLDRGRGTGLNKVAALPDYFGRAAGSNQWDDTRIARDATLIPTADIELRRWVLDNCIAFDGQHLIRLYRYALLLQFDPFVRDDLRAIVRDAEVAWDAAREASILAAPGGRGHAEIGREWAWASYAAAVVERMDGRIARTVRSLFGVGFAARMRRIAKHVQHRRTGILQRFVEGMSGSPYPFGPPPASGVPEGQGIGLTQDIEAFAQVVALDALGLTREARALANTVLREPKGKWIDTDTGAPRGGGWHGSAHDQAWPALAVFARLAPEQFAWAVLRWKVPNDSGEWRGPFGSEEAVLAALDDWSDHGKSRWATEVLRQRREEN